MKTLALTLVASLLMQSHLMMAQGLSSRSNAVYVKTKAETDPAVSFPVIKWIAPAEDMTLVSGDSVAIEVGVMSKPLVKSIVLLVKGETRSSQEVFTVSGPDFGGEKKLTKMVRLLDGQNTLELVVETGAGTKSSATRVVKRPARTGMPAPPMLQVSENSVTFRDSNGNGKLDGLEEAVIEFVVVNSGRGNATGLILKTSFEGTPDVVVAAPEIPVMTPGQEQLVTVRITAGDSLTLGRAVVNLVVVEPSGFDSAPMVIGFETVPFAAPAVVIGDGLFTSIYANKLKRNMPAGLAILVQNAGLGIAEDVTLTVKLPDNVLNLSDTKVIVGTMQPGASVKLDVEFVANTRYQQAEIPIELTLTEKLGKYGSARTFIATMDQALSTVQLDVKSAAAVAAATPTFLRSAVDIDVPVNTVKYPNRYALVIGNEDYSQFQPGLTREQNVAFARNDARVFREYLINTLGCPENQVYVLFDATKGQINRELERVKELVKLQPGSELIFYYAGHGLPDFETRKGYLIPVDISGANIKDGISLSDLYGQLAATNASRITVFLDACFSGGGRGENGLLAARTVKIKPTGDIVDGNIIVYTATSGEEASLPIRRESHGLFTYYLLRKINETKGSVTMQELKDYLEQEIPKASLIENGMKQTPQLLTSPKVENTWLSWKF